MRLILHKINYLIGRGKTVIKIPLLYLFSSPIAGLAHAVLFFILKDI